MAAQKKFESETVGIYKYKYSRRVAEVVAPLRDLGIEGIEIEYLQANGADPPNTQIIKTVGDLLMHVSDKLIETEKRNTQTIDKQRLT